MQSAARRGAKAIAKRHPTIESQKTEPLKSIQSAAAWSRVLDRQRCVDKTNALPSPFRTKSTLVWPDRNHRAPTADWLRKTEPASAQRAPRTSTVPRENLLSCQSKRFQRESLVQHARLPPTRRAAPQFYRIQKSFAYAHLNHRAD